MNTTFSPVGFGGFVNNQVFGDVIAHVIVTPANVIPLKIYESIKVLGIVIVQLDVNITVLPCHEICAFCDDPTSI